MSHTLSRTEPEQNRGLRGETPPKSQYKHQTNIPFRLHNTDSRHYEVKAALSVPVICNTVVLFLLQQAVSIVTTELQGFKSHH